MLRTPCALGWGKIGERPDPGGLVLRPEASSGIKPVQLASRSAVHRELSLKPLMLHVPWGAPGSWCWRSCSASRRQLRPLAREQAQSTDSTSEDPPGNPTDQTTNTCRPGAGQNSCVVPQLCAFHFESAEHLELMLTANTGRSTAAVISAPDHRTPTASQVKMGAKAAEQLVR